MPDKQAVTVIPGDGIGPEVVGAAQRILEARGVPIAWEECHAGSRVFRQGIASGVPQDTLESIRRTRIALKGPLETPVGFGEKSANVTLRKLFETFGNIRPVRELPGVPTPFAGRGIDLVIVRENVEDLYAGIEYMQTPGVAECLKVISRKGCEKIVRLAFEFARAEGRTRVHCATKANIMKKTEGLLKRTFEDIAPEYPGIETSHIIVDNCAHQLVRFPQEFDVIVTTNMNGDILSDLTSGLIGGLGFAPSANLGADIALFEAVHGSAPALAGRDAANPTALIFSATMMLRYLGFFEEALDIEHALLFTLESGLRTGDVIGTVGSIGTRAYTDAIINNLGRRASSWRVREYRPIAVPRLPSTPDYVTATSRRIAGVDVFLESALLPEPFGRSCVALAEGTPFALEMVASRGTQVYPSTGSSTDTVDAYYARFRLRDADGDMTDAQLLDLLARVGAAHRWTHLEKLNVFDGVDGFTKAQGQD